MAIRKMEERLHRARRRRLAVYGAALHHHWRLQEQLLLGPLLRSRRLLRRSLLLCRRRRHSSSRMPGAPARRWWVFPRPRDWWENFVLRIGAEDASWSRNFRMKSQTLFELVDLLTPYVERRRTVLRQPISPCKRVALTVWWLANVASYREVAVRFGVGVSTVALIVMEVCNAIQAHLLPRTVQLGGDYTTVGLAGHGKGPPEEAAEGWLMDRSS